MPREPVQHITDVRGTAFVRRADDASSQGWFEMDSTSVDEPGRLECLINPYQSTAKRAANSDSVDVQSVSKTSCASNNIADNASWTGAAADLHPKVWVSHDSEDGSKRNMPARDRMVIRLPSFEQVKSDPVLYAHASRVLHQETNPGNARALVQSHGEGATARDVWINPPPIPLTTPEIDLVFDLPYARSPHPDYADENGRHDGITKIPAWEMIRFSVNIMRGCFGGCTFCSITEHEGAHHPEPLRRFSHQRDRGHSRPRHRVYRNSVRLGWADSEHVPHGLQKPKD